MKKARWDVDREDITLKEDIALKEETLSSDVIYQGVLLDVRSDKARLPDGSISAREWIKHPGACAVIPVFEDGTIQMIRQFRYPLGRLFLEVPAGKIDPGEAVETTAKRELLEETGLESEHLVHCGKFYPCIGYSDEIIHVFVAWGLSVMESGLDEDEFVIPVRLPFRDAVLAAREGKLGDSKTICSLTLAAEWWKHNAPFQIPLD